MLVRFSAPDCILLIQGDDEMVYCHLSHGSCITELCGMLVRFSGPDCILLIQRDDELLIAIFLMVPALKIHIQ